MENVKLLSNAKRNNLEESEILLILHQIKVKDLNKEARISLSELFCDTKHLLVTNAIALIMEEFPSEEYKKVLLKKYLETQFGFRGTLIFAMTSYDYSHNIDSIIDKMIETGISDEEQMAIYDIFNKIDLEALNRMTIKYCKLKHSAEQKTIIDTLITVEENRTDQEK